MLQVDHGFFNIYVTFKNAKKVYTQIDFHGYVHNDMNLYKDSGSNHIQIYNKII